MKRALIGLLIVVAIGAGAGAYYIRRGGPEMQVNTSPITRGDILDTVGASGTLQAVTTVQVGSQVSGNISFLGADFNSIVQEGPGHRAARSVAVRRAAAAGAGQPAAVSREPDQGAERSRAREGDAHRRAAEVHAVEGAGGQEPGAAERSRRGQDRGRLRAGHAGVSAGDAPAVAGRRQPVAGDRSTRTRSTSTTPIIEAPIDGIIIQRSVDVGQTVAASMQAPTLFIIAADLTKMQVNANIDEADVGRIRPGQHVTFQVDAYPTDTFEGTVVADPPAAGRRAERDDLRHGHRRAEPAAQAQAGHDGERQGRDREALRRAARAERGAAVPADRPTCSRRSTRPVPPEALNTGGRGRGQGRGGNGAPAAGAPAARRRVRRLRPAPRRPPQRQRQRRPHARRRCPHRRHLLPRPASATLRRAQGKADEAVLAAEARVAEADAASIPHG